MAGVIVGDSSTHLTEVDNLVLSESQVAGSAGEEGGEQVQG